MKDTACNTIDVSLENAHENDNNNEKIVEDLLNDLNNDELTVFDNILQQTDDQINKSLNRHLPLSRNTYIYIEKTKSATAIREFKLNKNKNKIIIVSSSIERENLDQLKTEIEQPDFITTLDQIIYH